MKYPISYPLSLSIELLQGNLFALALDLIDKFGEEETLEYSNKLPTNLDNALRFRDIVIEHLDPHICDFDCEDECPTYLDEDVYEYYRIQEVEEMKTIAELFNK